MASIIRKTVEIKRNPFYIGDQSGKRVTVPGLPYKMVESLPGPLDPDHCTYGL
jgi:hypothetical protein